MERCLIRNLQDSIGSSVRICGKIASLRDHGKILFIDLADRSGGVQCFSPGTHQQFAEAQKLSDESILSIVGTVKERPEKNRTEGINGNIEFVIEAVTVLSHAAELPFSIESDITIETKFDHRPITLRRMMDQRLFKIQAVIVQSFRDYLSQHDFVEFQAPSIVGGDAEGGAEVFSLDYFDTKASLATSPQLYKQILVGVFERVFCVGEVFRAEKHSTSRHLNEYTSMDFEMGYISDHMDVMQVLEGYVRYMTEVLESRAGEDVKAMGAELPVLPKDPFPVLKFTDAQQILQREHGISCEGESDLAPEHERKLCEYALEKYSSDYIFITHYPVEKRPMYAYEDEEDPGYTKSFDLLFRGVEVSSGGQRIHTYTDLIKKIQKKLPGVNPEEKFGFYLQAFKYGMPPHGGMALGLERLTAKILGIANAKEAAIFPRDRGRIDTRLYE